MKNIFNMTKEMLEEYFISIGEKKFKATQVFEWLYIHKEYNIDNFSNIKKEVINKLKDDYSTDFIKLELVEEGNDVKKFLFRLLEFRNI